MCRAIGLAWMFRADVRSELFVAARLKVPLHLISSIFSPVGGPRGLKTHAHWEQPQPRKRDWAIHTSSRIMRRIIRPAGNRQSDLSKYWTDHNHSKR